MAMALAKACMSPSARRLWWLRTSTPYLVVRPNSTTGYRSSIEERGPYTSRLKSRGVLRVEGEDSFRFLQGILTNDLRYLQQEPPPPEASLPTVNQPISRARPLYSALLNSQGRFLFDLFLYRQPHPTHKLDQSGSAPGNNGSLALLCDVDATTKDELLNHLMRHKLRAKVEFEDVSKELSIWQRYGGSLMQSNPDDKDAEVQNSGWGAASDPAAQASIEGNNKGFSWYKDSRCGNLGYRGVFPSDTIPPLVEADKEVDEVYYLAMRLDLGIAEGCSEISKGKAIPLEYNLAWLNAISFDKGCYVGQELIARTHHRGVIRKRLMPIKFVDDAGKEKKNEHVVVPGAEILDTDSQKKVGDVTTVLGASGLGVIRLEAASKDASQLVVKDANGVHVKVERPKWWPADWCPDDLQQS